MSFNYPSIGNNGMPQMCMCLILYSIRNSQSILRIIVNEIDHVYIQYL